MGKIIPHLWFDKEAEEAVAPSEKAKINFALFRLNGLDISAMDNCHDVEYGFNEACSFIVECDNQEEIDYYWEKLSAVP